MYNIYIYIYTYTYIYVYVYHLITALFERPLALVQRAVDPVAPWEPPKRGVRKATICLSFSLV